jgi:hypothetical protein
MLTNVWLAQLADENIDNELAQSIVVPDTTGTRCVICKGTKLLCGKYRCPILVRFYSYLKLKRSVTSTTLSGASPPAVFVGRIGYPYVYIGPLIPPMHGDTTILDTPELWYGKSIDEIVDFRSKLVRAKYRTNVFNVEKGIRTISTIQEVAMAEKSVETDIKFSKIPSGKIVFDSDVQPFGPSAPFSKISTDTIKLDWRIEKTYFDDDLKAHDAILHLYKNGTIISKIQRAFSAGIFGLKKNRRFVPTRWSITAVDSTISKHLMDGIKTQRFINEFRVYESVQLDNRWLILMMPSEFCYELIEAWYPGTVWNPYGKHTAIFSDFEFYKGRSTYADIGGCYYAARLAVTEKLSAERRQAGVVIFREAHPGYIMPVGVWNVRENVRAALKKEPKKFNTVNECLHYISGRLAIPLRKWMMKSVILPYIMYQKKLDEYCTKVI